MELTDKQEQFCQEYLIDLNATQAAVRAGYSVDTAGAIGHENLKKPEIQDKIAVLQAIRAERTQVSQDQIVRELMKVAFGDVGNYFDENGNIIPVHEIETNARGAISAIKVLDEKTEQSEEVFKLTVTKELKMWDKLKALEMLGRHVGIFERDNKQSKPDITANSFLETIANRMNGEAPQNNSV